MKNRKGFALIAAIFILLVVTLLAIATTTFVTTESVLAVKNYHSLRAFYIAEAGVEYACATLEGDSDWSDNAPFSINFGGGSAYVNFITAETQMATVEITATFEVATRKIRATMMVSTEEALPEAFNYAVFWNNSAGTPWRLRIGWNTDVVGDVGSKGNVRVRSDSSVTGGKIYVSPGYDVVGPGTYSWEVSSTMPDFPTIDYSYYDDLITSYEAFIPTGSPPNLNWNNSNSPTVLTGEVVECRNLYIRQGHVVRGHGIIAASRNIDIGGNAIISPEGGSIVFISSRNMLVHTGGFIRNTTAEVDFATIFFSRNRPAYFFNNNMRVQNALIMSKRTISIFNRPYLGDNTVMYVPAANDNIYIHDRPSIEGSVICRGRLRIYGGRYTGLVYCDSSWGTMMDAVSGTYFHGALVSDTFRNDRIQDAQITWGPTYIPPLPPGMEPGGTTEVVVSEWREVYD